MHVNMIPVKYILLLYCFKWSWKDYICCEM